MRIAVCFAGHLRKFDNDVIYGSIQENLLSPLRELGQVDIFFSTWNKLNTAHSFSVHNGGIDSHLIDKPIDTAKLIDLYDPVAIDIESFDQCYDFLCARHYVGSKIDKPIQGYHGMLSLVPQAYKVHRVNQLRVQHQEELGIVYDAVVRYRPDWAVKRRETFPILDEKTLFIPGGYEAHTVEDHFAYGDHHSIDIYCSLYLNLKKMFALNIYDPSACRFLYIYLKEHNINVLNLDLDFQRHLV